MSRAYVRLEYKSAQLSSDFGVEWATKLFGADTIAALPRLTRGPRKGKIKGYVCWQTAATPGWCREYGMALAVGQIARAWLSASCFAGAYIDAPWMGRIETINFSPCYLFTEGRARKADENRSSREIA